MGPPLPAGERITRESCPAAGSVSLRVIGTKPATAPMFRLDQLVAAMARRSLWITDAYFVGASPYVQALVAAAEDGVDVRMLVPSATDLPLVQPLTRAGYRQLLEAGVRIFEWNLNLQSWLGNWELDVAVEDENFGLQMEAMYQEDLQNATEIVLTNRRIRRAGGTQPRQRRMRRPRWSQRTGRTRRAAAASALHMGQTFGDALRARRVLGAFEAWTLLYGAILLGALGLVGLKWPTGLAYPLGGFLAWLAVAWLIQAIKLLVRRRDSAVPRESTANRREDAA
jgi:cardiolipin synthase